MSVSKVILEQLGGVNSLTAMTGAHDIEEIPISEECRGGVWFTMKGRNASGCGNIVEIKLNFRDLYDVRVMTRNGRWGTQVKHSYNDIYNTNLVQVVEEGTGRYLSLFGRMV